MKKKKHVKIEHVVFDHDGTLVDVAKTQSLYAGISELLEKLCQSKVKLYVWTARTRFSTVEFLNSLGIIRRFEELRCSTDGDPKPAVSGLRDMLPDADPSSVLVVGDSSSDMAGAKNFGAFAIGAVWDSIGGGKTHRQVLEKHGADFVAETVKECEDKILEMIKK